MHVRALFERDSIMTVVDDYKTKLIDLNLTLSSITITCND